MKKPIKLKPKPKVKTDIDLASELESLNSRRRKLEKREKELKEYFKEKIPVGQSVNYDGVLLAIKSNDSTGWRTKELKEFLGPNGVRKFQKKIAKIQLSIERIDRTVEIHPATKISPIRAGRKGK